jgi:hypothetical protein
MNTLRQYGYKITTNPEYRDKEYAMTPELKERMEELYFLAHSGEKSDVKTFLELIEKHPRNPQLKNYLSTLYGNLNNWKECNKTNHWIVKEHPDYLFGLLNLASEYIEKKEFSKVPQILGESMEIKDLYPDRDTFHLGEVAGYYKMAIHYFTSIRDYENAEKRYEILEHIAPDHPDTKSAGVMMLQKRLLDGMERMKEEEKLKIKVKTKSTGDIVQTIEPPEFHHIEIETLYQTGLYITKDEIDSILNLPQDTLIKDLETILNDVLVRYEYYKGKQEKHGWNEKEWSFAIHAIFFLGELKAAHSLPLIIKILSQDRDFLDFWYGDFLTSNLWEPLLKLGKDELEAYKQFMCAPGINTYSKSEISVVAAQIALHFPERRKDIVAWFKFIFNHFLNSTPDANLIDSDLIGLMIGDAVDIQGKELMPEIERLYEHTYVSMGICGNLASVRRDIESPPKFSRKREILSVGPL